MNLCNFCKKEIIDIDNSSKFCSHNCKLEHFKKRYPPKKEKKCNFCNNTLDFNFFRIVKIVKKGPKKGKYVGWRTINNDYRASRCLNCEKKEFKSRYTKNPIPQMLSNSKIRAKNKGVLHTITSKDLENIWPKDNLCPVLKIPFDMSIKSGKSKSLAPSLDRIVPKKGYTPGNLVIVCDIVNRVKSDATLEQMEMIFRFYSKLLKSNK